MGLLEGRGGGWRGLWKRERARGGEREWRSRLREARAGGGRGGKKGKETKKGGGWEV